MTALCNQPKAFSLDLGDDQSRYLWLGSGLMWLDPVICQLSVFWRWLCLLYCRHLSSQLVELEHMIDHMMREEFLRFCTHDLNRPIAEHRTPVDEVAKLPCALLLPIFCLLCVFLVALKCSLALHFCGC